MSTEHQPGQPLLPLPPPGYGPIAGQGPNPGPPQYPPPPQWPQPGYDPQHAYAGPRRKRRVFLWVFLAIQALFIVWLIAGLSASTGPSVAQQVAKECAGTGWVGLFSSHADCMAHAPRAFNDAADTGKGIGVALVILFWCIVDFLVGGGYAIYRLASRRQHG